MAFSYPSRVIKITKIKKMADKMFYNGFLRVLGQHISVKTFFSSNQSKTMVEFSDGTAAFYKLIVISKAFPTNKSYK